MNSSKKEQREGAERSEKEQEIGNERKEINTKSKARERVKEMK